MPRPSTDGRPAFMWAKASGIELVKVKQQEKQNDEPVMTNTTGPDEKLEASPKQPTPSDVGHRGNSDTD